MPPGIIYHTSQLEELLAEASDEFSGDDEGMEGYKLIKRMEDVLWNSPQLTFKIERHGITVMGSTRAELQGWTVNIREKTVTCEKAGIRQKRRRQPPLNVRPLAEEIASLVLNRRTDDRLTWHDEHHVKVNIGKILPKDSAVKETLTKRRKRFREVLTERLAAEGWMEYMSNVYKLA